MCVPCRAVQDTLDALLAEEEQLAKEIAEEEKQREAQLAAMREKMGATHDEL
jgi:phage shock protein A